ncbi:ATP-binding protein [Sulfitobacter sp. S190]|uniref:sensor histidine kinase n=1 Tax=Sulfitobacter sp. S190 TaxID=2867022 RepID=UPI0021A73F0E|nr:ATP-binding protein [Sulfitobacter sp. S190]UWR23367.1 type IV pili methyl-accepting chemotaxis transducer N-terminal domain-containing protein [Sulfitobacter sp. S190]
MPQIAAPMDAPNKTRQVIRRLMGFYLLAIALLFTSVASSLVLTQIEAQHLASDAKDINVSGRQRMLSQRIIYLAQEISTQTGQRATETQAKLLRAIDHFEASISLFEGSHGKLVARDDLPADIKSLYFDDSNGPSLNARVLEYIENARRVLLRPRDVSSLQTLKDIEAGGLLRDLDAIVTAFESASVARLDALRRFETYSILIAIGIILIEIVFVFRPGHRMLHRTFSQLESRNTALEHTRAALDQANRELEQKNHDLTVERTRLREAWTESERLRFEQADFTYSVSHDMKSPANTIHLLLNEIDTSHAQALDADGRELLSHAIGAVSRMSDLIEDVLEYSWATDHRAEPETFEARAVFEAVQDTLAPRISDSGAQLTLGQTCSYFGYKRQVEILLQNLLSNAIKFQADGATPDMHVGFCPTIDRQGVVITVRDNGIGIDPANHDRVFGLFQRLHVRETYPGTGLGLTTCRRIADNHGGDIEIISGLGAGTTVRVTLNQPILKDTSEGSERNAA